MYFKELFCPKCRFTVEIRLLDISTKLGPPVIVCPRCKALIKNDRKEWEEFSPKERIAYYFRSICYTIIIGLAGGLLCEMMFHYVVSDGRQGSGSSFYIFIPCSVVLAALVIAVQIYRKNCSIKRTKTAKHKPFKVPPITFELNVQMKFIGLFLIILLLGLALSKLKEII